MSILKKVTLEFDDKVMTIEGTEARKWDTHNLALAQLATSHNMNPFEFDPIKWEVSVNKNDEPLFGVHIKEAIKDIKELFKKGG